jgi:C-terminal processing protease CtpA/Prc
MKTYFSAICLALFLSANTLQAEEKGALGVMMSDNKPGGTLITSVLAGSPAAKIGLQAGDRILTINGEKTNNFREVERITAAHKPGDKVELVVLRGPWKTKLTTTLGAKDAVFTPTPNKVAPPKPIHVAETSEPTWDFTTYSGDDGMEGVAASYGGGGY